MKVKKHLNPLKQALHYCELLQSGQAESQTELSRLIGTSRSTISSYLRLLSLSEAVKGEVLSIDDDDNRISMLTEGRLRRLPTLADPAAQSEAFQAILNGYRLAEQAESFELNEANTTMERLPALIEQIRGQIDK